MSFNTELLNLVVAEEGGGSLSLILVGFSDAPLKKSIEVPNMYSYIRMNKNQFQIIQVPTLKP